MVSNEEESYYFDLVDDRSAVKHQTKLEHKDVNTDKQYEEFSKMS